MHKLIAVVLTGFSLFFLFSSHAFADDFNADPNALTPPDSNAFFGDFNSADDFNSFDGNSFGDFNSSDSNSFDFNSGDSDFNSYQDDSDSNEFNDFNSGSDSDSDFNFSDENSFGDSDFDFNSFGIDSDGNEALDFNSDSSDFNSFDSVDDSNSFVPDENFLEEECELNEGGQCKEENLLGELIDEIQELVEGIIEAVQPVFEQFVLKEKSVQVEGVTARCFGIKCSEVRGKLNE
ncbi:MAG: hypothetical protein ABIA76_02645 [Candidatus Diapherotrites archaeon]